MTGPSSAVPVFPATSTPEMAAAVPVPFCTTPIIRLRISSAMSFGMTRTGFCELWSDLSSTMRVGWRLPPLAIV